MLYNYLLDGTRVIADPAVNLAMNNINLNSLDDYNNYIKYLDSAVPAYTAQELLDMTHYVDETFTAEKMVEVCQDLFSGGCHGPSCRSGSVSFIGKLEAAIEYGQWRYYLETSK